MSNINGRADLSTNQGDNMNKRPFEELEGKTILYYDPDYDPDFEGRKIRVAVLAGYDEHVGMCIVDKEDPLIIYFIMEGPGASAWEGDFPVWFFKAYEKAMEASYNMLISGYFSVPKFEKEVGWEADYNSQLVCPFSV